MAPTGDAPLQGLRSPRLRRPYLERSARGRHGPPIRDRAVAMAQGTLALRPGTCVVFEGLDATGKSTQLELLKQHLDPTSVVFGHMPSGFARFTSRLYEVLEDDVDGPSSGLARQLAHLACHAEAMAAMEHALREKALVLDRCWWSTIAYGWYGGSVPSAGVGERAFADLVGAVWAPILPSIIFAFMEPHGDDVHNSARIRDGYRLLVEQHRGLAIQVPRLDEVATHQLIVETLVRRGFTQQVSAG